MQRKNILIIDDDHRERARQCQDLESLGYYVNTAHDATDAVKKMKANEFHLIISEYELSGCSGLEIIKNAKSENEDVEVLFVTRTPSVENAVDAMKAGAFDFIVKPVDTTHMRLCVQRVFDKDGNKEDLPSKRDQSVTIVTQNKSMIGIIEMAQQVAESSASVFIHGESGTGKELLARFVHEKSKRQNGPFVAVNCAALPESLLESELFGHEKGAFTGAISKKPGKFEIADGGTILLDEVTEMAPHLQAKLLRIIQEREIDRVGGIRPVKVDIRIISTSNRNLRLAVENGDFREDLYYRLNTIPIRILPLRERSEDIELLAHYFLKKYNAIDGRNVKSLTKDAMETLNGLYLKGNVRELENIVHRAILLSDGITVKKADLLLEETLYPSDAPDENGFEGDSDCSVEFMSSPLREVEKKMIFHTLDKTKGNRTHAAKMLGISVRTLRNKLNEYKENVENF